MKEKIVIGGFCFFIGAAVAFFAIQFFTKTGIFKVPGALFFDETVPEADITMFREAIGDIELEHDVTIFESFSDSYYLDSFNNGAKFKLVEIHGEDDDDTTRVRERITSALPNFPKKEEVLTFAQTGVTAMSRGMNAKMAQVGDGKYFSANLAEFLRQFDFTHTSNESSFSNWASASNICSDWRFLDTLTDIGLDIVELTGNHNVDCGAEDAISTYEKYQELDIKTVGGGRNAVEAELPLRFGAKGTNVTMLAYNQSTGGATLGDAPGANQYYPENAQTRIREAKERGDFIIVDDVQFNECNAYDDVNENTYCDRADSAPGDQVGLFQSLVDMGTDVVVGTSAHQTQTFEQYNGGEIYYGLGNVFFDHQTRLMNMEEIEWFISRLNQTR